MVGILQYGMAGTSGKMRWDIREEEHSPIGRGWRKGKGKGRHKDIEAVARSHALRELRHLAYHHHH